MSRKFIKGYPEDEIILNQIGQIVFASGTTKPTDATAGYVSGAIYVKTGAAAGLALFINRGSVTSCSFKSLDVGGLDLSTLVATAAEINRSSQNSSRPVSAAGANLTVTQALHDGKTIMLDQATGTAVTLPAMSGSGARYRFVCTVNTSGGSQVITATAAHLFGSLNQNNDTAQGTGFQLPAVTNASGSTVITLDGSTKGGRKGDWFEIEDLASGFGMVRGQLNASGSEASPFS